MSEKVELKTVDDRENLRSYGYSRLQEYLIMRDQGTAAATLIGANYIFGVALSNDIDGYTWLRAVVQLFRGAYEYLLQTSSKVAGAPDMMHKIDSTADALYMFATAWFAGALGLFLDESYDYGTYVSESAAVGPIIGGYDELEYADIALAAPDPQVKITELGWYYGTRWHNSKESLFPGTTNLDSDVGVAVRRAMRLRCVEDAITAGCVELLEMIQDDIANIQIGRLLGLIPSDYEFFSKDVISPDWKFVAEGRHTTTNIEANVGVSVDNLTNYVDCDYSYLPVTLLDLILNYKSKEWLIPAEALAQVRKYFGICHSDWDFPTEIKVGVAMTDETNTDAKKVGYHLYVATTLLSSWFSDNAMNLESLIGRITKSLHWSYKPIDALCGPDTYLTKFTLSSLKGICDPSIFPAVKWAFRTIDSAKNNGYYYTNPPLGKDATDALVIPSQFFMIRNTTRYALYVRGGWKFENILDYLWYEIQISKGATTALKVVNPDLYGISLQLGEHKYTRTGEKVNYVSTETNQINEKIGCSMVHNANLQDAMGVDLVTLNGTWTARDIPARLPTDKFPLPMVIDNLNNRSVVWSIVSSIYGRFRSNYSVKSEAVEENKNKNSDKGAI